MESRIPQSVEPPLAADEATASHLSARILTVKRMAAVLGCTVVAIHNKCHRKQIPYYKSGGQIYFDMQEVEDYLLSAKNRVETEVERSRRNRNEASKLPSSPSRRTKLA